MCLPVSQCAGAEAADKDPRDRSRVFLSASVFVMFVILSHAKVLKIRTFRGQRRLQALTSSKSRSLCCLPFLSPLDIHYQHSQPSCARVVSWSLKWLLIFEAVCFIFSSIAERPGKESEKRTLAHFAIVSPQPNC